MVILMNRWLLLLIPNGKVNVVFKLLHSSGSV